MISTLLEKRNCKHEWKEIGRNQYLLPRTFENALDKPKHACDITLECPKCGKVKEDHFVTKGYAIQRK